MNLRKIFTPALNALRLYWRPFLAIQLCAVTLVVCYYNFEELQDFLKIVEHWKIEGGLFFSMWTTIASSVVLAELAKAAFGKIKLPLTKDYWKNIFFVAVYFGLIGMLVDLMYQGQGLLFGYELSFWTTAKKIFVDMLVWNPLFAAPFTMIYFTWVKNNFNLRTTLKQCNFSYYKEKVLPLLSSTWVYWLPMVSCVYSMPATLQFPLFLCAQAAWSLIMVFIAQEGAKNENLFSNQKQNNIPPVEKTTTEKSLIS